MLGHKSRRTLERENCCCLPALTVSAYAPDGTVLGSMPLLGELLRPGSDCHLRIAVPAPEALPSEAPQTWAAWLAHRQRSSAEAQQGEVD
jgi:hypothetical protein